jgi:hypothetical protein
VPVGQEAQEPVLREVRVLVLVHEHVAPEPPVVAEHLGMPLPESHRKAEEVVEVDGAGAPEPRLVDTEEPRHLLVAERARGGLEVGRRREPVLCAADPCHHGLGRELALVHAVGPQNVLDQAQAVVLVVDDEVPRVAEMMDLGP